VINNSLRRAALEIFHRQKHMKEVKNKNLIKRLTICFAFVAVLTFCSMDASAQEPKRIEFGKGKSSATVRGTTGLSGATYSVRARSGQKLVLTITPRSGIGIKVESIGRFGHMVLLREERGGTYEVGLEESGDYTIFVGTTSGKAAAFTLSVRIVRMTDI
jgi:hypothetical protein